MKLFRVRKKNNLNKLINNLEKIGKISALRLEKDYTDSVISDLIWIQESFIKVLLLKHENSDLFFLLIDPHNRFRKVTFNQTDFENFSFSIIEELPPIEDADDFKKNYEKLYTSFENPGNTDDLILRYIQTIFNIWNAANLKENFLVQKYCLYVFTNWITILDRLKDPDFDYQSILKYFLDNLTILNVSTLELEDGKLHPMFSLLTYSIYLNKIFTDEVNKANIDLYFEFLFRNLYQALRYEKYLIVDAFIERCIDSNYYPSNYGNYSSLYSMVAKKMQAKGIENYEGLLKPIPHLGFYTIKYIKSFEEHINWENEFDDFISNEISDKIDLDQEINLQISQIKRSALKSLKYNKLQISVLKILTYSLFKKNTSLIKHAFEYNQPNDSNAIQGNKEILPTTLPEILNLITYRYQIEHELFPYWVGHHSVEYYLDQLFVILLYKYNPIKIYVTEDPKNLTVNFCKDHLKDNPGPIDGFKQHITRLKTIFNRLIYQDMFKSEFFHSPDKIKQTNELLDKIIESIDAELENIEETGNLEEETQTNFLIAIIAEYENYNFLLRIFKNYGHEDDNPDKKLESIGMNELMDRTAFVENWHIPYIGIIENRGKEIAEQENRMGQFAISPKKSVKINVGDILSTIKSHTGKQRIVIGRNINFDSILRDSNDYQPYWKNNNQNNIIPKFYVGSIGDTPIFNLYDELFDKSILVVDIAGLIFSEQPGEEKEPFKIIGKFKTSFIDFNKDLNTLEGMVDQPPLWLQEQFGNNKEELRKFLKKKVWVRIFKQTLFEVSKQAHSFLYDIT